MMQDTGGVRYIDHTLYTLNLSCLFPCGRFVACTSNGLIYYTLGHLLPLGGRTACQDGVLRYFITRRKHIIWCTHLAVLSPFF